MGTQREAIMVIGEGETEYYYMASLKNHFPQILNMQPRLPKHSSLDEMAKMIDRAIDGGYSQVYCLIDMDNKNNKTEAKKYSLFKTKYNRHHKNPKKGIDCRVYIIETERCTELFFLYYFQYTTAVFDSCEKIVEVLRHYCSYEKTQDFFKKNPLHSHFIKNGGDLSKAIKNAHKSLISKSKEGRMHTYSEIGSMLSQLIGELPEI
ncbi:MAG: RloB family protein [Bacteroidales bacterium]|nr:RloB family protein [Bacteroidales bacterium]